MASHADYRVPRALSWSRPGTRTADPQSLRPSQGSAGEEPHTHLTAGPPLAAFQPPLGIQGRRGLACSHVRSGTLRGPFPTLNFSLTAASQPPRPHTQLPAGGEHTLVGLGTMPRAEHGALHTFLGKTEMKPNLKK